MVVNIYRSISEDLTVRSGVFGAFVGTFLLVGVYIGILLDAQHASRALFPAIVMIVVLPTVTGLQAYYHGSTVLAFALLLAVPIGVQIPMGSLLELPIGEILFGPRTLIAFMIGGPGHIIGAELSKHYDASGNPSTLGQLLIAMAITGLLVLRL